ncbi:MAG TPA: hypothetical protein VD886_19065 [Herpetosiphonaceae bacterium]|nr:hypothetical protein [Herpetosiphonaceae bacterium]
MGMFMGEGTPVLLQTITVFEGRGLTEPQALGLRYAVPPGRCAGMLYFRAGSTVSGMVNISITRDGALLRYFPLAADSAMHVSLAIVEEHPAGSLLEVWAAGEGSGMLILDIGYLEV